MLVISAAELKLGCEILSLFYSEIIAWVVYMHDKGSN